MFERDPKETSPNESDVTEMPIRRGKKTHKDNRTYDYHPKNRKKGAWVRTGLMVLCAVVLLYSGGRLVTYGIEAVRSRALSKDLREVYRQATTTEEPIPAEATDPPPSLDWTQPPPVEATPEPTVPVMLEHRPYPKQKQSSRIQKLQRQNKDIVGWLTVEETVDEAVVQRDNTYYLRRDYRGYHNDNGAIFLEETCDLSQRPYTMVLYGHNMKTGAMFGSLRKYENISYYRNAPFIQFDTLYEEGTYVIFAINTISLNPRSPYAMDFAKLYSLNIEDRNTVIRQLQTQSVHWIGLDVDASDQLLMLMTCVADDDERRVVAARHLREGETKESLKKVVAESRKR